MNRFYICTIAALLMLCGCSTADIPPEPTASPVAIVETPKPSSSPTVSPTQSPTAEPIIEELEEIAVAEVNYNRDLLPYTTIEDESTIEEYAEFQGEKYLYSIYRRAYFAMDIVVSLNNEVIALLTLTEEETGEALPSRVIREIDVNFDGVNDILVSAGHFGAQGALGYKCYIVDGDNIILGKNFLNIPNPSIDIERQVIGGQWRNGAASHSWAFYKYIDGSFVGIERLTEEPVKNDDGVYSDEVWGWTDEVFADGEWHIREYFTTETHTSDEINEKLYGPSSYWGLMEDRWSTIYNGGKMRDFSIYGSEPKEDS